ncbi:hypothetical protein E4T38_02822 [Aureobasidium subglaciale]|nr:hypothetical protein E4T38_02822 [Aureobasidium subglaciale]KAI5227217.1 hypothetical protein E4T40_02738 [Aureobasidium subglaciale]KAI5230568.1 hypothetical protein E4T41_02821 [Aureobasidium subglaciale]KAI5264865.1 hypothetical protein E4T46_02599 [Aureobasidium subglaciale]
MPDQRQAQPQPGILNFVTFGETQSETTSTRAIRSHAAKVGWKSRKTSRSLAAAARNPMLGITTEHAPKAPLARPRQRTQSAVPSWPDRDIAPRVVPSLALSTSYSSPSTDSSRSTPSSAYFSADSGMDCLSDSEDTTLEHVDTHEIANHQVSQPAMIASTPPQTALALKPNQLGSTHDPFSQFPVSWQESYGPLVQFYRSCLGEAWMGLITVDWGHQGNTEFVDFPLQISIAQREPAMFYAVLSNTSTMAPASNAISMRQQPFMSQWLRHKAVESLRVAIMDPKRAYTDAVILTVTYVYFNEAVRSERDIALKVHGPALKRMVAARGGIGAIAANGKDGLILSRYLSWCDRIISSTLDIPLLFGDYVEDSIVSQTYYPGMWSRVQNLM